MAGLHPAVRNAITERLRYVSAQLLEAERNHSKAQAEADRLAAVAERGRQEKRDLQAALAEAGGPEQPTLEEPTSEEVPD